MKFEHQNLSIFSWLSFTGKVRINIDNSESYYDSVSLYAEDLDFVIHSLQVIRQEMLNNELLNETDVKETE